MKNLLLATKNSDKVLYLLIAISSWASFHSLALSSEDSLVEGKSAESWLQDLSGKQYIQRKRAFQALWKVPSQDLQRLFDNHLPSGPSEVDLRNWLKLLQRIEASPESAARLIDDLARIRSGDFETILRLGKQHRWSDLLALLAMLSPEDLVRLQKESQESSVVRTQLISLAWDDSRTDLIPALVDQLWEPKIGHAARLQWKANGLLELAQTPLYVVDSEEVDNHDAGETNAFNNFRPRELVSSQRLLQLEVDSQEEEAISAATQNGRFSDAEDIALRTARWELLPTDATRQRLSSNSQELLLKQGSISVGIEAIERAKESLVARWSGDPELAEQLLDAIGNPGLDLTDVEGVALALAVGDRVNSAIEILEKRLPDEAFATYWVQEKIIPAFRSIGVIKSDATQVDVPHDLIDMNSVKTWLDAELAKEVNSSEEDIARTKRLAEVGSLLARIGKPDQAKMVDLETVQYVTSLKSNRPADKPGDRFSRSENADDDERSRWKTVLRTWLLHHRRPIALEQFYTVVGKDKSNEELQGAMLDELYPKATFPNIEPVTWQLLQAFEGQRNGDRVQAAKDLERFAWGLAPEDWNGNWEQSGFSQIVDGILPTSNRDLSESELTIQLARLAIENSRYDLALAWIEPLLPKHIAEVIQRVLTPIPSLHEVPMPLSREEKKLPNLAESLTILDEVYEAKQDFARQQAVLGMLQTIKPDIEYIVRRARCLRQLGEVEAAYDLEQLALTVSISPESMYDVQQRLDDAKLFREYATFARATSLSMSASHPNHWFLSAQWFYAQQRLTDQDRDKSNLDKVSRSKSLRHGLHAGRLHLWSRLNAYPARVPPFHYCLFLIERIHRYEARLAVEAGDWETANIAVEKCWRANPDQIETLLELVPLAREKFGADEANLWIKLYSDPLESHLAVFPDDTLVGNNLAWLYANLDWRLDRAKELSKRVNALLDLDHMYLDTLGEVEFRLGNVEEAIAIAKRCRQLAPRESHYERQLVRYQRSK